MNAPDTLYNSQGGTIMQNVGRYPTTLLLNILTDGIEWSARGFWAQIERYRWSEWYEEDGETVKATLTPDTSLLRVRDHEYDSGTDVWIATTEGVIMHRSEDGEETTICGQVYDLDNWVVEPPDPAEDCPTCIKWVDITLNKLAEATDWALVDYNHLFSHYSVSKGIIDDIDYDAIGADVIIQKIVLGEVVYG